MRSPPDPRTLAFFEAVRAVANPLPPQLRQPDAAKFSPETRAEMTAGYLVGLSHRVTSILEEPSDAKRLECIEYFPHEFYGTKLAQILAIWGLIYG